MLTLYKEIPENWRQILRKNFNSMDQLAEFLKLSEEQQKQIALHPQFVLNLPLRLAEKIEKGCLDDPILRQFVPLKLEETQQDAYVADPVGDQLCRKAPKLLHKYEGRVLLVCTSACAMHCRYCFRQHFEYQTEKGFEKEIELISQDPSIREVILSGGDPLSLSNHTLHNLLIQLDHIPHIKRIRFHTRFPIGIPERIDDEFLEILSSLSAQIWFVIHCNHPRELDQEVLASLKKLQRLGATILNQSVLLKGINDSVQVLQELSEKLVDNGILPYYLHQLDRVQGAAHFEVSEEIGKELTEVLTQRLSGYAVPKYVREIAGQPSKTKLC